MNKGFGHFFMIVGPSGVGKTTLTKELLDRIPNLQKSISYTTRDKRPKEEHGVDYYFISKEEYLKLREISDLIMDYEYEPNNQFYGTSRTEILSMMQQNINIIDETDEESVVDMIDNNLLDKSLFSSIYILPPSEEALRQRLELRGDIGEDEIYQRLEHYKKRLLLFEKTTDYYDLIITNDSFEDALEELKDYVYKKISIDNKKNNE